MEAVAIIVKRNLPVVCGDKTAHTGRLLHRDHISAVCMRPKFVVAVLD